MSKYLHGFHDRGGEHLHADKPGWTLVTEAIGCDPGNVAGADYTGLSGRGFGVIVRLNNGYGNIAGTVPEPRFYPEFAATCAAWVAKSKGANIWIIGNEVNHEAERPSGRIIAPEDYAGLFTLCRNAIKKVNPQAQVIPAAIAPYHASPMDWLRYFRRVLEVIEYQSGCDGIAIHAYTRSASPADILSEAKMGPPLSDQYSGFRTYRDALGAVPVSMRHLPAYITEFDEYDEWADANTGVVQAAYAEIDRWNDTPGTQKIHTLILYRWSRDDKWSIQDKTGVQTDFRAAVAQGYRVPAVVAAHPSEPVETFTPSNDTFIPFASTGTPAPASPPSPHPELEWDERLTKRGIELTKYQPKPGEQYFKLTEAEYWEEKEHTFVETLDGNGDRLPGVTLVWWWGAGGAGEREEKKTELKPGDRWMVDFPMYNAGRSYGLRTRDIPGDQLFGMGLGSVEQPDWNIHVSYKFTFMLVTAPTAQPQPEEPVVTTPASTVPKLVHPVADPRYRTITQRFGPSSIDYSIYRVDGVPLKGHNGLDFGTPVGTPIAAVASGRVVEVADEGNKGYGKYIKLVHQWGESLYAHLSEQRVRVHEQVTAGQEIGRSGNTGHSTGAHLHFGLRVWPFNRQDGWGGYTDPLPYLSGTAQSPEPAPASPSPTNARILQLIKEAAAEFGLDWRFVASLAWHESSWIINATSPAGAMGIMQLMPRTWAEQSVKVGATNPYDERDNIRTGTAYLKRLLDQLGNHEWRAVVAYNFGIGNVTQGVEPPAETVEHANRVIRTLELLEAMGV